MSPNAFNKEIDELFHSAHVPCDRVLPADTPTHDAVEASIISKGGDPQHYLIDDADTENRAQYIYAKLGHIPVNPTNLHNTMALSEAYVCLQESGQATRCVNENPESGMAFLKEVMHAAKTERDILLGKLVDPVSTKLKMRPLILHGARGAGKTFFLNHVFSKHSDFLDSENVMWVRLNLVDDFSETNTYDSDVVMRWIYAQMTKIVFRYYDPKSDFYRGKKLPLDLYSQVMTRLAELELPPEDKQRLQEALANLASVFRKKKREERLAGLVPKIIGTTVFELAQAAGYSIAVVFDGLDRLEATTYHADKYIGLVGTVRGLVGPTDFLGMAFVCVTRTNNLRPLLDFAPPGNPYSRGEDRCWEVKEAPLDKIIERRIAFLRKNIRDIAGLRPEYREWASDWPAHIDEFEATLGECGVKAPEGGDDLTDVLGTNRRAQVQFVQFRYRDFLLGKREKPYLLIESLCRGGKEFPSRPYTYIRDTEGNINRFCQGREMDHHFLPSVFLYPQIRKVAEEEGWEQPHKNNLMCGLRVLQLVNGHEIRRRQIEKLEPLSSRDIAEACEILFEYPRESTLLLIEEFGEFEFLSLRGKAMQVVADRNAYSVRNMPKGDRVLQHLIGDVAYLNLSAMRALFRQEALEGGCESIPFVRACNVERNERGGDDRGLRRWIDCKIANAVGIYKIIVSINESQKNVFKERSNNLTNRLRVTAMLAEKNGMFTFVDDMLVKVRSGITHGILPSMVTNRTNMEYIERSIAKYRETWFS